MSSVANRLSDLVMLVAALEEKGLRDEERIKDLLARNERLSGEAVPPKDWEPTDELVDTLLKRVDELERALFDVRHSVLNEVTFATHPQRIILSAILKRIGEALERK